MEDIGGFMKKLLLLSFVCFNILYGVPVDRPSTRAVIPGIQRILGRLSLNVERAHQFWRGKELPVLMSAILKFDQQAFEELVERESNVLAKIATLTEQLKVYDRQRVLSDYRTTIFTPTIDIEEELVEDDWHQISRQESLLYDEPRIVGMTCEKMQALSTQVSATLPQARSNRSMGVQIVEAKRLGKSYAETLSARMLGDNEQTLLNLVVRYEQAMSGLDQTLLNRQHAICDNRGR